MRDYSRIPTSFWLTTARILQSIGNRAVELGLYLYSGPSSNMTGLYYLPIPTISHELKIDAKQIDKLLSDMGTIDFAHYDKATACVWVVDMVRNEVGYNLRPADNRLAALKKELLKYSHSYLVRKFIERYGQTHLCADLKLLFSPEAPSSPFEAPSKGVSEAPEAPSSPFEAPSKGVSEAPEAPSKPETEAEAEVLKERKVTKERKEQGTHGGVPPVQHLKTPQTRTPAVAVGILDAADLDIRSFREIQVGDAFRFARPDNHPSHNKGDCFVKSGSRKYRSTSPTSKRSWTIADVAYEVIACDADGSMLRRIPPAQADVEPLNPEVATLLRANAARLEDYKRIWDRVLNFASARFNTQQFTTWILPTRLIAVRGDELVVLAPNSHFIEWLTEHEEVLIAAMVDARLHNKHTLTFISKAPEHVHA